MNGAEQISAALRRPKNGEVGLVAYLTGGWPDPERFLALLDEVSEVADVVEVGVPFSDPMADGVTLQRTAREALERGFRLRTLIPALRARGGGGPPLLLMGYTNPFLQYGFQRLADDASEVVHGWIIPDLPVEEAGEADAVSERAGLANVRLIAPNTSDERLHRLVPSARGFVYAVTVTGITGAALTGGGENLARVRALATAPVCAGFGIRTQEDVRRLAPHVDGVIVGTALAEVIGGGGDVRSYLRSLRGA